MKRLHYFIIKSFLGPFLLTFFISIFVLMMQMLWRYIDDIIGKGLEWGIIGELLFYMLATLVPLALPLAILLASLMTFGNMGEYYELTALKSAGISLTRIMKSLIIFVVMLSFSAFFFANNVMPVANLKMYSLLYSIKQQNPEVALQEGIFITDFKDIILKVDKIDRKRNMLYDLIIYNHSEVNSDNRSVTIADSGRIEMTEDKRYMILTLYDGYMYNDEKRRAHSPQNTHPFRRDVFRKEVIFSNISGFDFERRDEKHLRNVYKMLSLAQLEEKRDSLGLLLDKQIKKVASGMRYNGYMSKRFHNEIRPDSLKKEMADIITVDSIRIVGIDTLFQNMNKGHKLRVLNAALSGVRDNQRELSIKERDFYERKKLIKRHDIEWYRKFTLSLACLIFFFIGAPLGAIIRKGGLGMPVVVSVILFIFYHILSITGEKFVREGVWTAWQGMWLSTAVFLPLGIFFTYKAATDSTMMSTETYLNIIKKLNIFVRDHRKGTTADEHSDSDK